MSNYAYATIERHARWRYLNGFTCVDDARLLAEAARCDRDLATSSTPHALLGLPIAIKAAFGGGGFDATTPFVGTTDGGITFGATLSNPFPNGFVQAVGSSQGANALLGQSLTTQLRNIVTPYTQQFNITVQRQIGKWLFDGGYVGSRGIHQWISYQADQIDPRYLSQGTGLNVQQPNPFAGLVTTGTLAAPTVSASHW